MSKIRVGIVNYLNTKPLLYGIENAPLIHGIELVPDYPANIAAMLLDDKIDMGLVPVAVIPRMKEWHIITQYCIGCDGAVASVCLLSEAPLHAIKKVLIDYQSRTSANLVRVLLRHYWKIEPELVDTKADFRNQIEGTTAGLVIGDRCLEYRDKVSYVYDLGLAWKDFTGLPFVFAAWIANKKLDSSFIEQFNKACENGIAAIDEVAEQNKFPNYDSRVYFRENISYTLDEEKRRGLEKFLQYLAAMPVSK